MTDLRALDRLVAQHVMGLPACVRLRAETAHVAEIWGWRECPPALEDDDWENDAAYALTALLDDGEIHDYWEPPFYSSRIADAWLVVEKMRQRQWRLLLEVSGRRESINAVFDRWLGGQHQTHDYTCLSVPEAICRAALSALGPGVEVPA